MRGCRAPDCRGLQQIWPMSRPPISASVPRRHFQRKCAAPGTGTIPHGQSDCGFLPLGLGCPGSSGGPVFRPAFQHALGVKTKRRGSCRALCDLEIEVLDAQGVLLDELPSRLDHVAHQLREQIVCLGHILDLDLQQGTGIRIQSGFPELIRVHFP